MKRFCALAVLMVLSSSAYAGNSFSFGIGGHRIRIEAPRHCNSPSCVSVSIPGLYETRRGRDRFRLAPVFRARRTIVFPASVLELVGVVRASGSLEYFHQPAARRVFELTNWRMVSGRIMTRVPTFT